MGGKIENWIEEIGKKLSKKFGFFSFLSNKNERLVAASHFSWMGLTTLFLFVVSVFLIRVLNLSFWFSLILPTLNYIQIVIAEWGEKGRRVDWITRSAGWFFGYMAGLLSLLKY